MSEIYLSAHQQKRSAQIFNMASIVAVMFPPVIFIWIAASIFVYATIAYHPNPKVVVYLKWAGYRFYGLVGTLVVLLNFSGLIQMWVGGTIPMWIAVWVLSVLVIVPLGVRDIRRAASENWSEYIVFGGACRGEY